MTLYRAAFIAALCSIFLASCGDTFRPIAIPQPGPLPTPQASKTAQVITDNAGVGAVTNYNLSGGTITGQAPLGRGPSAALLFGSRVYVANSTDDTLSVYSATSPQSTLPGTITLDPDSSPSALAAVPGLSALYVAYNPPGGGAFANTIALVSAATNVVSGRIPLNANGFTGDGPVAMMTNTAGTKLFVANEISDNISVIDLASNAVVASLGGGGVCMNPVGFARTPDTQFVYAVCHDSSNILILDSNANTVAFTVPVGSLPTSAVYDATNKRLIVTNSGSDSLSVLAEDLTRPAAEQHVVTTVPLGATPITATVLPDGSRIYVANTNATVGVVTSSAGVITSSTFALKTNIPVGGKGQQIVASSDSLRVGVTTDSRELKAIDTATETVVATHALVGDSKTLLIF